MVTLHHLDRSRFTTFPRICPIDLSAYPAIQAYLGRLDPRPLFRKPVRRFAAES